MIPYRRALAVEHGHLTLQATDVAPGDVVLIRRPSATERTPETVLNVVHVAPGVVALHFRDFIHEASVDTPVDIRSFTDGSWRQNLPIEQIGTL